MIRLIYSLRHIPNPPLNLPFFESFETSNTTLSYTAYGINGLEYADYTPEVGGRFRSDEGNLFAKAGNRAVSLDNYIGVAPSKRNELIFLITIYPIILIPLFFWISITRAVMSQMPMTQSMLEVMIPSLGYFYMICTQTEKIHQYISR
ncbi:MAG: hypothetical protein IPM95_02290 [Sphingobacteriales bacterium]|nr:hypothetical protein [Sphingobacteriales bacterium]